MRSQVAIKIMWAILLLLIIWIGYQECESKQVIIVEVSEEESVLSFYEKKAGKWTEILKTSAVIGKNGLGKTKEGDMKTPIGEYRFIKAFGILENPGTKLEYIQVDESHYWVDDTTSKYYNQFISTKNVKPDWTSAEHICEYGELYHYVLATSYNEEAVPGKGSAVFLHCLKEGAQYTAGCIAIPENYMKEIMQRIEADCVLIIRRSEETNGE